MVMEATPSPPSPQCVGREFVRQYYTLLNKAPAHLHRFYNNQSSFVHGGLDPPNRETSPMIGQKQIHQKIQQLNFQDCHAKITQVDSQATLGNGVVVQVTGELSNAGQPMRRFTQTFVLAAQTPKKYYVHNDIFRYQDEIFTDEECDQESGRSDADDEMGQDQTTVPDVSQPISQQQLAYYAAAAPTSALQAPQGALPPMGPGHQITPQVITPAAVPAVASVATVNGAVHPEEVIMQQASSVTASVPPGIAQMPPVPASLQSLSMVQPSAPIIPSVNAMQIEESVTPPTQTHSDNNTHEEISECVVENDKKDFTQEVEMNEDVSITVEPTPPSNEPKTYATSLKSGGGPISFASAAMSTNLNQTPKPNAVSPPPPMTNRNEPRDSHPMNSNSNQGPRGPMRQNRGPPGASRGPPRPDGRSGNGPTRNSFTDDNEDRRRSSGPGPQYGDSHQLFLGNLPLQATEDELRQLFSCFGPIADLRVHSKPSSKGGMPGARVPNYGFITFEDITSVQKCLQGRPLYFPPNSENGQKLNVEEKKTRPRGMDSSGGSGRMPNSGPGNNQQETGNTGNNIGRGNMNAGPGSGNNGVRGSGGNNSGMMRAGGVGGGTTRGNRSGFNRSEGGGRSGGGGGGGSSGGAIRNSNNFNRR